MSDTSAKLSLPYLQPAQAQKHVTHNEALRRLDIAVQLAVEDRDRIQPPAEPATGQSHLIAAGAIGDWAGRAGQVASWDTSGWIYTVPGPGWRAHCLAEGQTLVFDGTGWIADLPELDNLHGVGIGTTADVANVLAVQGQGTLLSHAGAGHRITVNKSAPAETASLLFQTGWAGRAEMGTTGSDTFAIKVSVDGANWVDSLRCDPASGRVILPQGAEIAAMDASGGDLDALPQGLSRFDATTAATPGGSGACGTVRTAADGQGGTTQTAHLTDPPADRNKIFVRVFAGGSWTAWREV
ncbi:DUF2793 domain-containing protein [Pseudooceanicola aestuarii]|uniref:DUF2793 domain-containing protein n=1 Tax=Pseudooceanicola aestuarii TaxID=2697319 RepID=UPI0013D6226C|nr:DUF2793 domain-containing protein [Pseudooceanicola aestuarii]